MQLWSIAALLILHCSIPLALGFDSSQSSDYTDINNYGSVGTVPFKGSKLRVYDIDGVRVAEPRVAFSSSCGFMSYNHMYLKYQLSIPIRIDTNTLPTLRRRRPRKVGQVSLTGMQVVADKALTDKGAKVTVLAKVKRSGQGVLVLLCDSFIRCQALRNYVASNPEELWTSVQFVPIGRVGGNTVRFGAARSASAPRFDYCNRGKWIVFQRRVDGSLSFAQNWDEYVKGFGNPKSNYWMGLNRLFAMTATSKNNGNSYRCRLRIDTVDFKGKKYWAEYGVFEVLNPEERYRLRLGKAARGSNINMAHHNGMQFSTYDRDHDRYGDSCSKLYGYGGWWYNRCHNVNLNGAYTTDKSVTNNPNYDTVYYSGRHIPMKRTEMKFKCY